MDLLLKYMENNLNDLSEYPLESIGNLAEAADFLLVENLLKKIEYFFFKQAITTENVFQLMAIAECFDNTDFLHYCADFAFYLPNISIQNIPSIQQLVWYLSQSQLYATNESEIFRFGFEWLFNSNTGVDSAALLMILGCLDVKRLTTKDLVVIRQIMSKFENSLAAKVVECLIELLLRTSIVSTVEIIARKTEITEKFTEHVYDEVLNLVKYNRDRRYEYTCVVPVTDIRSGVHYLLTFTNEGLKEWLKIDIPAESKYLYWNIAAWGPKKLILVYNTKAGNYSRYTNAISIKAYDVGKKEWTEIDTKRIQGSCHRIAVVGDSLYIICSSGHCLIYNLEQKECLEIAELPFKISVLDLNIPLICVHNDEVYVCDNKAAYKYEERYDSWVKLIEYGNVTRLTNMVSHGEYIHVTDDEQRIVYRFKPDVDEMLNSTIRLNNLLSPLEISSKTMSFKSMIIYSCSTGDELLFFTTINGKSMIFNVENFNWSYENENQLKVTYATLRFLCYETYRDACRLILTPRSIDKDISEYLKKILMRYNDAGSQSASCSSLNVYLRQGLPQSKESTTENAFQPSVTEESSPSLLLEECFDNTQYLNSCANFGFYLSNMKSENISSVQDLVWYLSQSQLYASNESEIFRFGFKWLSDSKTGVDSAALLMILGCLDVKQLTTEDLFVIKQIMTNVDNNFAAEVINCLIEVSKNVVISTAEIIAQKTKINEKFTENVYDEVLNLVKYSRNRKYEYTCIIPVRDVMSGVPCLYTFTNEGLKKWLKLDISDSKLLFWNIAAWGPKILLLVHITRDSSLIYNIYIKAYDIVKKECTHIDNKLYSKMCQRIVVVRDSLYIICAIGRNLVYNLKQKVFKNIAELPFKSPNIPAQMPPDVPAPNFPLSCVHDDEVYVSDCNAAYKYREINDSWIKVIEYGNVTGLMSNMVSHGEHIYVTDALQRIIYRFKPGVDETLNSIITLGYEFCPIDSNSGTMECNSIINSCSTGDQLLFFTSRTITDEERDQKTFILNVEEFNQPNDDDRQLKVVYTDKSTCLRFDQNRDACKLIVTPPSIKEDISEYLKNCLMRYNDAGRRASCNSMDADIPQEAPQSNESNAV